MSASNEWTEWHLTPAGWQRGTEKEDFRRVDRDPPPDRVQTAIYREFVSSTFSPMEKSLDIQWEGSNKQKVDNLRKKYGPPPSRL
jgi:hypothetical protein